MNNRIACLPWPGLENCFLYLSGQIQQKRHQGDKWYVEHEELTERYSQSITTQPHITFTYRGETCAAEWDGAYGPITVIIKREEGYKDEYEEARPNHIYPWASGRGNWSQCAVDDNGLYQAFNTGDYEKIFRVLESFVRHREMRDRDQD